MSLFICPRCENTFSTWNVFKNFLFSRPFLTKKVKCTCCSSVLKPEEHSHYGANHIFSSFLLLEIFWYIVFILGGVFVWKGLVMSGLSLWWFLGYILLVLLGIGYQLLEGRGYGVLENQPTEKH